MALGTATFFIALLAFFIGIEVGRSQADAPEVTANAALLPDANRQDALEALLREVETAQAEAPPMAFNETLAMDNAPEPPVETISERSSPTEVPPAPSPAPPPAAPGDAPIPKTGWSIQVASYDSESDANSRVAQLKEKGLKSYRVGALIKGRQWYRVRVGAYPSKKAAETARLRLQDQFGGRLLLAEAP
jgi:DedD protein